MNTIRLPKPQIANTALNICLQNRKSTKDFDAEKQLSCQQISNILNAAYGFNRSDKRTVPSAMNCQEFTLYVFLPEGIFIWNDVQNDLILFKEGDYIRFAGEQDYVASAAMNIVYVADLKKMNQIDETKRESMAYADCGFIAQNAYLACSSENLGCVIRGYINKSSLSEKLQLTDSQKIILSQSIGFSK